MPKGMLACSRTSQCGICSRHRRASGGSLPLNKDTTSHGGWVVKGIAGKAEDFANLPSATKPLTKT